MKKKDFCEAPHLGDFLWRLPELWTDPVSNQLSGSRFAFFWLGMVCAFVAIHETLHGRATNITTMLSAAMASAAGVYFMSTAKDFRWRCKDKE